MVGAHQHLNGSRDLNKPLQGCFAIRGLALAISTYLPNFEILGKVWSVYLHSLRRYDRR